MRSTQKPAIKFNADNVWAAACAAQRINDSYVKFEIGEPAKKPNRTIVEQLLATPSLLSETDRDRGNVVRDYYKGFMFKVLAGVKLNEFDNSAMTIANRDDITSNYDIAVITSLPSCYERIVKRDDINSRIQSANGGFVASVGSKVRTTLDIIKATFSQNYQCWFITGITKEDQAVFFSYRQQLAAGSTVEVAGTVKAHRDNSTQLSRVKVI